MVMWATALVVPLTSILHVPQPHKTRQGEWDLQDLFAPLMSFALGGNETLAPSSFLHAQGAEAGHLLGVFQRLRAKDATFQQPWPSPGMANRDSTLRCRPLEVGHFWRLFNNRAQGQELPLSRQPLPLPAVAGHTSPF